MGVHSPWGTRLTGGRRAVVWPVCDFLLSLWPYEANTRAQLRAPTLLERGQNPENFPRHMDSLGTGQGRGLCLQLHPILHRRPASAAQYLLRSSFTACSVLSLPKRGNPCPGKQTTAPEFAGCVVPKQDHDQSHWDGPGKGLGALCGASAWFIPPFDLAIQALSHLCSGKMRQETSWFGGFLNLKPVRGGSPQRRDARRAECLQHTPGWGLGWGLWVTWQGQGQTPWSFPAPPMRDASSPRCLQWAGSCGEDHVPPHLPRRGLWLQQGTWGEHGEIGGTTDLP